MLLDVNPQTSPLLFYEGKCQEKRILLRAEAGKRFVAFSPRLARDATRMWLSLRRAKRKRSSPTIGRRETAPTVFTAWLSLLLGKCCSERPRSRPGRADRLGQASLDGEDRSEIMGKEGKQVRSTRVDFLKRVQARWDARNVCQPWLYMSGGRSLAGTSLASETDAT